MTFLRQIKSSLSFKLTFPIVIIGLVLLLSLSFMLVYQTNNNIQYQSEIIAKNISDTLVIAVETNAEQANLRRVVSSLAARNKIQRIIIVEQATGIIAADNHHASIGLNVKQGLPNPEYEIYSTFIASMEKEPHYVDGSSFYHLAPIRLINPIVNRIRKYQIFMVFNDIEVIKKASADLIQLSSLSAIGILLISLALYFVQRRVLLKPLASITQAIEQQDQDQDQKSELINPECTSGDELGLLVNSYNNLIEKKTERDKELMETRRYIDGITNSAPVLLSYVDKHAHFRFVNQNYTKWFDAPADTFEGHSISEALGEKAYQKIKRHVDKALTGQHVFYEIEMPYKQGSRFVQAHYTPDIDANNQVRGFFACVEDMTEAKKNELKLAEYAQKLEFREIALKEEKLVAENALKIKSEFLASMSHEIRTPMNGVLGMLGLLMNTELTSDQMHKASLAKISAESLLTLINDILDFSKIESGKMDLEAIDFDVSEMFGNLVEMLANQAQSKGIELILDTSEIDRSLVKGDPGRIRQVITNLVSNAIKFTLEGQVHIRAAVYQGFDDELDLICEIKDSGIGIAPSKLKAIFDSFSQVDASTTRKFGGTGLGLAIAKNLCQLMGGDIQASSEEGKGSTFKCSFVLEASPESKTLSSLIDLSGTSILVVDANTLYQDAICSQLACWGANAKGAYSGDQAIELLEAGLNNHGPNFSLALIDSRIEKESPIISDLELIKRINQHPRLGHLKLILMTPLSDLEEANDFASLGFSGHLFKPVTMKGLQDTITSVIEHNQPSLGHNQPSIEQNQSSEKTSSSHKSQSLSTPAKNNASNEPIQEWPSSTRILLVEDVHINQLVVQGILEVFNLTCDVAANGLEALDMVRVANETTPYTLVFMDCLMPELDGYQATKLIREGKSGEEAKTVPIVAMTANAMKGDEEECLASGMDDYISKPLSGEKLEEKLVKWLIDRH